MAACTRGGMWDMWWEALRAEMLEAMAHTKERVAIGKLSQSNQKHASPTLASLGQTRCETLHQMFSTTMTPGMTSENGRAKSTTDTALGGRRRGGRGAVGSWIYGCGGYCRK